MRPLYLLTTSLVVLALCLSACTAQATPVPTAAPTLPAETPAATPVATVEPLNGPVSPASLPSPTIEPTVITSQPSPTPVQVEVPAPTVEGELPTQNDDDAPGITERRSTYDTSRPFADLVKPHFYAVREADELVDAEGEPELLVELDGKVKVRISGPGGVSYLDPLALESELVGEHPVHKVYRLEAMGVPVDEALRSRLQGEDINGLFTSLDFEYQRRRFSSGVVVEVFVDGTFLVIPDEAPSEWQSNDDRIASPTHLHLNARALSGGSSGLARDYELEILSLPFEDQRYPPAPLARKQCDVYWESLATSDYMGILDSVGFRFTPSHTLGQLDEQAGFSDRLNSLLWQGSGPDVRYFGFEGLWIGDVFRSQEVPWLGECDTAGSLRSYSGQGEDADRRYLIIRRSLEPDKKQRYRIVEVDGSGGATELYTAPGIVLMALPLPFSDRAWLFSTEGWSPAEGDQPADPRWQAIYMVDLDNPDEYVTVRYPIDDFPRAPEAGLYGASARMSQDGGFLFNTLYGFKDEGGGIWVADVSRDDFHSSPDNFARIVSWDHTLSWMPLGRLDDDPTAMHLFMTGKEVADDFAMTANVLRVREDGLHSAIEKSERLLQMVGWNPVPFGWQKLSDTEYRMLVETHYNYESSLMPRAKGVYIIPVSLTAE